MEQKLLTTLGIGRIVAVLHALECNPVDVPLAAADGSRFRVGGFRDTIILILPKQSFLAARRCITEQRLVRWGKAAAVLGARNTVLHQTVLLAGLSVIVDVVLVGSN